MPLKIAKLLRLLLCHLAEIALKQTNHPFKIHKKSELVTTL